jgi:hypothetical protein
MKNSAFIVAWLLAVLCARARQEDRFDGLPTSFEALAALPLEVVYVPLNKSALINGEEPGSTVMPGAGGLNSQ